MSARVERRALKEQDIQQSSRAEGSTDDEVECKPAKNFFSLLGSEDFDDGIAKDLDGEDSDEVEIRSEPQVAKKGAPVARVSKNMKKRKGKRKGKNSTSISVEATHAAEEESVDELLERLALQNEAIASTSESATFPFEILGGDPRYLRAEDELRRIFGSKVIKAAERSGERAGMVAGRKRQVSRRGGRVPLKKTMLVTPHDDWPRPDVGLSMEYVETREGTKYFRYIYSSSYQELQKKFDKCVASHDPSSIGAMFNIHPYHVDSLLTLSEVYRQMGQSQTSVDLLEKCLYVLECAWHPSFNITTGRCRLDFEWDPNISLAIALFRHMLHLDRRGCHRAAFEVCKVLYALGCDSYDPKGSLFCIDYFAIRAEQSQWLTIFMRKYLVGRPLELLPNFTYSHALAQFHIEDQGSATNSASSKSKASEVALEQEESSTELLQRALMLHPAFLNKIVDKAPIKVDAAWTKILQHDHFSRATSENPSLEHLTIVYVARNYILWRAPDVQTWLKEGAQAVVNIADEAETGEGEWEITKWAASVLKETFPADENEFTHIDVNDFSDHTATIPPEEMQNLYPAHGAAPELPADVMLHPDFYRILDFLQVDSE